MMAKMTLSLDMAKAACSDLDIEKKSRYHSVKVGVCQALSNDGRLDSTFFSSLGCPKTPITTRNATYVEEHSLVEAVYFFQENFKQSVQNDVYIYIYLKKVEK